MTRIIKTLMTGTDTVAKNEWLKEKLPGDMWGYLHWPVERQEEWQEDNPEWSTESVATLQRVVAAWNAKEAGEDQVLMATSGTVYVPAKSTLTEPVEKASAPPSELTQVTMNRMLAQQKAREENASAMDSLAALLGSTAGVKPKEGELINIYQNTDGQVTRRTKRGPIHWGDHMKWEIRCTKLVSDTPRVIYSANAMINEKQSNFIWAMTEGIRAFEKLAQDNQEQIETETKSYSSHKRFRS
jgi:hypothetical protein